MIRKIKGRVQVYELYLFLYSYKKVIICSRNLKNFTSKKFKLSQSETQERFNKIEKSSIIKRGRKKKNSKEDDIDG